MTIRQINKIGNYSHFVTPKVHNNNLKNKDRTKESEGRHIQNPDKKLIPVSESLIQNTLLVKVPRLLEVF